MKKIFFLLTLTSVLSGGVMAQQGNVIIKTVDKPLPRPLGSFIIFYTNGNEINNWQVFEVWDKSIIGQRELMENLYDRINKPTLASYEWKPGYRWEDAARFAKSRSSRFAFTNSYTKVDGSGNSINSGDNGSGYISVYTGDARRRVDDGEVIDFSKEDYVAQLPPAEINKLKSYFNDIQKELLADGWVRYASSYQTVPYKYDQINRSCHRGYSYAVILVCSDTAGIAIVNEYNNSRKLLRKPIGLKDYAIYYDMQSFSEKKTIEAKVESSDGRQIPVGVILYRKPVNFVNELQQILTSTKDGFQNLRSYLINTENDKSAFAGKLTLGHNTSKVSFNNSLNKWEYVISSEFDGDDAVIGTKLLAEYLEQKEKEGEYIIKRSKSADNETDITEVFDKKNSLLLKAMFTSYLSRKLEWIFYEQL